MSLYVRVSVYVFALCACVFKLCCGWRCVCVYWRSGPMFCVNISPCVYVQLVCVFVCCALVCLVIAAVRLCRLHIPMLVFIVVSLARSYPCVLHVRLHLFEHLPLNLRRLCQSHRQVDLIVGLSRFLSESLPRYLIASTFMARVVVVGAFVYYVSGFYIV